MLNEGDKAPSFDLEADDGSRVSLESLRGRNVVLFFYPKDDTDGCTREACGFRDALPRFEGLNADVFGVNHGDAKSHAKFRAKFALPYRLLVDADHKLSDAYGIWKKKKMFAVQFMGIERTTVLIDTEGRIARIFRKVRVDGHVDAVEKAVKEIDPG